jgi:hypothetical protein
MTDDVDSLPPERRAPAILRLLTLVAGSLEIIAFTLAAHLLLLSDQASENHALLILAPLLGLAIPGLVLALADRALGLAFSLVMLALPAAAAALTLV